MLQEARRFVLSSGPTVVPRRTAASGYCRNSAPHANSRDGLPSRTAESQKLSIVPQSKSVSTYHTCLRQIDRWWFMLCHCSHLRSCLPTQGGVTTTRDHVNKTRPVRLYASRPSPLQAIEPPHTHYTQISPTLAIAIDDGDHSHVHLQHADDRCVLHDCIPLRLPRGSMAIRARASSHPLAHRLVLLFLFPRRRDCPPHYVLSALDAVFSWRGQPARGRGCREALQARPHSRGSRPLRPCLDHWAVPCDSSGGQHRERGDDSPGSHPRHRYALLVHDLRRQHLGDMLSPLESGQYGRKGRPSPHPPASTSFPV